jgi:hypothetical protein
MTGMVARSITTKIGTWTVVFDSEVINMSWGKVSWTSYEPDGTSVTVKVRSSNNQTTSTWSSWESASNGVNLSSTPDGRYLQIETTLHITSGDESPILYDLTVEGGNQPPVADADGPYYGDVGENIQLDGSGSYDPDGSIVGYRWDWTNDGTYDTGWSSSPTATHSYGSPGTYTVKLQVEDNDGATDTDTAPVNIGQEGWDKSSIEVTGECIEPNAVFNITNTGEPGEGDMDGPTQYRVYRNEVLEETVSFQLNGGESLIVEVDANCDTIRLEADQRPGHPGGGQPQATVTGCGCYKNPQIAITAEKLNFGDTRFSIENLGDMDITGLNLVMEIKSSGFIKGIDILINENIEILKPGDVNIILTEIMGFGRVDINIRAEIQGLNPIIQILNGFVLGKFVIIY